jgi:hypothetical protein
MECPVEQHTAFVEYAIVIGDLSAVVKVLIIPAG